MNEARHIKHIPFDPPLGLSSPHIQTIMACFCPSGESPPSKSLVITLEDGDKLCCEVSTPASWLPNDKTAVMVHGLGGCHASSYMVRVGRKLFNAGFRVVRVNLRGCGSGDMLANRPYHGGNSHDIFSIIKLLKAQTPLSPIILIGFSLGGNIVLKLAGELGKQAPSYIRAVIATCPPVDLAQTAALITRPFNSVYNRYYLKQLERQAVRWTGGKIFSNIYEFDTAVTAPLWNFHSAFDYYHQCSSRYVLSCIQLPCHILFAADDPFIDYRSSLAAPLPSDVKVCISPHGGHMGFIGWTGSEHYFFWLDNLLLNWVKSF